MKIEFSILKNTSLAGQIKMMLRALDFYKTKIHAIIPYTSMDWDAFFDKKPIEFYSVTRSNPVFPVPVKIKSKNIFPVAVEYIEMLFGESWQVKITNNHFCNREDLEQSEKVNLSVKTLDFNEIEKLSKNEGFNHVSNFYDTFLKGYSYHKPTEACPGAKIFTGYIIHFKPGFYYAE
jgi:hypothetical protein